MISARFRVSVRIRIRVSARVQNGGCNHSGGSVVCYELQFLQWDLSGLALGLLLVTYVCAKPNGLRCSSGG